MITEPYPGGMTNLFPNEPRETPWLSSPTTTAVVFGADAVINGPARALYHFVATLMTLVVIGASLFVMFKWLPLYSGWLGGLGMFLFIIVPTITGTAFLALATRFERALFVR